MATRKRILVLALLVVAALSWLLVSVGLPFSRSVGESQRPKPTDGTRPTELAPTTQVADSPTSTWFGLQQRTPYAQTTPLPESKQTPIDGTYAKLDPSLPQWWACRRCADYRPAGGVWRMQFDRGVMRIYYNVTAWSSIASYTVSGDRLYLYNDAYCPQEVGEYRWKLEDASLTLEVTDDPCSIRLRGENLGRQSWRSCQLPTELAGANDQQHWPPGCEQQPMPQTAGVAPNLRVIVLVHPGYARAFPRRPDVYANANSDPTDSAEGILVSYGDESIPYGVNRVLWGAGDWVEATTDLSFDSMGVQIYGAHTIGWARVLFDGEQVWRGDTSAIWSHQGRHGGYIEISGFEPGMHTIRVESLGFDYRPVTVAYFGFSHHGGVDAGEP